MYDQDRQREGERGEEREKERERGWNKLQKKYLEATKKKLLEQSDKETAAAMMKNKYMKRIFVSEINLPQWITNLPLLLIIIRMTVVD